MLNNLLKRHHPLHWALLFLLIALMFQSLFFLSARSMHQHHVNLSAIALEKRIALDLPWLQLSNDAMKSVADKASVQGYLQRLNAQAAANRLPVRVLALQGIKADLQSTAGKVVMQQLEAPAQSYRLSMLIQPYQFSQSLSLYPLLAALLMTVALYHHQTTRLLAAKRQAQSDDEIEVAPKLIIDLHNRTFRNNLNDAQVQLSNKPFCFYIALVDYCLTTDAPALNHNKNVPEALLELANRNFHRLVELGHTIRKRPDFSTNLDKMLSEIRAALDEVFAEYPEQKSVFYPPKAQGEGSRSKLHNYALEAIQQSDLQFIGK